MVSKNPGGTKRVTSLADALKLNFGLVTTDRRRLNMSGSMEGSSFFDRLVEREPGPNPMSENGPSQVPNGTSEESVTSHPGSQPSMPQTNGIPPSAHPYRHLNNPHGSSPLTQSTRIESSSPPTPRIPLPNQRETQLNGPSMASPSTGDEDSADEYTDERAREVITGRLIQGHIVDDDAPSPDLSAMSGSIATLPGTGVGSALASPSLEARDPMATSFMSATSRFGPDHGFGVSRDANTHSDDEEEGFKDPELEHTITLVGNVRDKVVFIMDDMIDQSGSWVAAAETVVKRGGANKVYCIATHGLFGDDSLEQMEMCQCIDYIVVTNTYPIASERLRACKKLVVLDISHLLAEAIRRNHYGESISALFEYYPD